MFGIDFAELASKTRSGKRSMRILDCPGGPSSFTHYMNSHSDGNVSVVAVDPEYGHSEDDVFKAGCDDLMEQRRTSMHSIGPFAEAFEEFISDFSAAPDGTYISYKLPSHLPFDDEHFDLTLSGYLLFVYSSQITGGLGYSSSVNEKNPDEGFDIEFHRLAINELLRVTKTELRIFPAHTMSATDSASKHPFATLILDEVNATGVFEGSFYSSAFQAGGSSTGGDVMGLKFTRKSSHSPGADTTEIDDKLL
jgi:hypothetical protein